MNLPLTPLRLRLLPVALAAVLVCIALAVPEAGDARTCVNKREQKGCFLPIGAEYSRSGAPNGQFVAISGGWTLVYSATFPCTTGTDQGQEAQTGRRSGSKAQRVRVGKSYVFSGAEGEVDPTGLRTSQTFTAKVKVTKPTQAIVRYTQKKTSGNDVVCEGSGILKLKRRK